MKEKHRNILDADFVEGQNDLSVDSPSFRTYAFTGAGRRHHPTFENIPSVVSLHKQLQELRSLQL